MDTAEANVPHPVTPGAEMADLRRFFRDVTWKGPIVEGGMGPGTPGMTAEGRGVHQTIQDGLWIIGDYEQDQFLLDGTFVLEWQLHWVVGWDPDSREYRGTHADNYGHAGVMRGRLDGDVLTFETVGDARPAAHGLESHRSRRHELAERDLRQRGAVLARRGIRVHLRRRRAGKLMASSTTI